MRGGEGGGMVAETERADERAEGSAIAPFYNTSRDVLAILNQRPFP